MLVSDRFSPFSACTFISPGQSLEAGLDDVRRLGVEIADFGIGDHVAHIPLDEVLLSPKKMGRTFSQAAANAGVKLSQGLLLNFGPPTNDPSVGVRKMIDEKFPRVVEFLVEAGAASVMVTAGPAHEGLTWGECFCYAVDGLERYVRLSEGSGIKVCLEPDVDSFLRTPAEALRLLDAVPGLGLTLDLSHFVCRGIGQAAITVLVPRADLLHVRQASPGKIVDYWAAGSIDFEGLVRDLEAGGFAGEYCVEYLGVKPTLDMGIDPHEENAIALAGIRSIFENLKMRDGTK